MSAAPALRLVKDLDAKALDPVEVLRAELRRLEAAVAGAQAAAEAHRNLSRQWRTVASVLAKRLGGSVKITEEQIAAHLKKGWVLDLVGDEAQGELRLTLRGKPGSKAERKCAGKPAVSSEPAAPPAAAPTEGALEPAQLQEG